MCGLKDVEESDPVACPNLRHRRAVHRRQTARTEQLTTAMHRRREFPKDAQARLPIAPVEHNTQLLALTRAKIRILLDDALLQQSSKG